MRISSPFRLALVLAGLAVGSPAAADPGPALAVEVRNRSEPVLCAEKDNVTVEFASPEARSFRIVAAHPAYLGTVVQDSREADWTHCDISSDPRPAPRELVLHESPDLLIKGFGYGEFWRSRTVPFRVGGAVTDGLHLIQLWVRQGGRDEEVLVLYPADGYWRLRPYAPGHLPWTAYGSSVLIGPVGFDGRPVVDLESVQFDPATRTFTLAFKEGGRATVRLAHLDAERAALDVAFDSPVAGRPFATLRSMFVTDTNADVAEIALRGAAGESAQPVMSFGEGSASSVWLGRSRPSRHNTSAPDITFDRFQGSAAP